MVNNEDLLKDVSILYNKKIVLYGAGSTGIRSLRQLEMAGFHVEAFADGDSKKWGSIILCKKVLTPEELSEMDKRDKVAIIISSVFEKEISERLDELGIGKGRTFTSNGFVCSLLLKNNLKMIHARTNGQYEGKMRLENIIGKLWYGDNRNVNREKMQNILFHDKPILVYQPGKTGSITIAQSLEKRGCNAIHLHNIERLIRENERSNPAHLDLEDYGFLRNEMKRKEGLKIITGVREPIGRNLSMFFQPFTGGLNSGELGMYQLLSEYDVYDACLKYLSQCIGNAYGAMFHWFNAEIKPLFGIDVYSHPFDKEKGYSIIKKDNIELLIYKLECLDKIEPVIGDFVGCEDFHLEPRNVGSEKIYASIYNEVRENIKFPQNYIEFYYKDNPGMDHFYTEEEKREFIDKWKRNMKEEWSV